MEKVMNARFFAPLILLASAGVATAQSGAPVIVTVESNHAVIGENQTVTFTFRTTENHQPTRWRVIGYWSEDSSPILMTGVGEVQTRQATGVRGDVGRKYTACMGAWEAGNEMWRQEADQAQQQLMMLLQSRKSKADELKAATARVNAADDRAQNELNAAWDIVQGIASAGQEGGEQAANEAWALGLEQADQAWADAAADFAEWERLLGEMDNLDAQLRALIQSAQSYYVAPVSNAESRMVTVEFREKETATTNRNCKVRRELAVVRPLKDEDQVRFESSAAGKVTVTKKGSKEHDGNKAALIMLELQGGATVSGGLRDIDIQAFVGDGADPVKTMPHTNSEYKDVKLARTYDADEDKACFCYDDFKVAPENKNLLIYLRGFISPPVSRAVANLNLHDNLRLRIPAVDDSDADAPKHVLPVPRRPAVDNKKEATIEFVAEKLQPGSDAEKSRIAIYNGEGTGAGDGLFVTVFAYQKLPRKNTDFGAKEVTIRTQSIDGDNSEFVSKDVSYFYTFRAKNRPSIKNEPPNADKCINGFWYASPQGSGGASAAPNFTWANIAIGTAQYSVFQAWQKGEQTGLLAETSFPPATQISFFGGPIAHESSSANGYGYAFSKTKVIKVPTAAKREERTCAVTVLTKRFGSLIAHLWMHEHRHGEQQQRLAGAQGDIDTDGDGVMNGQESANNTDYTVAGTWAGFPISSDAQNLDAEIDAELRAVGEMGTPTNDWAMDRLNGGAVTRQGPQWKD
jgi:hypothetical protein